MGVGKLIVNAAPVPAFERSALVTASAILVREMGSATLPVGTGLFTLKVIVPIVFVLWAGTVAGVGPPE